MDLVRFAEKRALEERRRKQAMREALTVKECAQVREILQDRPATTREIAARTKLSQDRIRRRARQIGASRDEAGRWGLQNLNFARS